MKNIIIIGASGNISSKVIDILVKKDNIKLTLFLRNKNRLKNEDISSCKIIEGDALNFQDLKKAISGQDIVYVNLAGNLSLMSQNIVRAMKETGVKKVIFIVVRIKCSFIIVNIRIIKI